MRVFLLVLIYCNVVFAGEWSGKKSAWHGYSRYDFEVSGKKSYVVVPDKPIVGNLWVLRARFPSYHTEVDELLLKKGYHIAYTNVAGLYGSPQAVDHWSKFYKYLIGKGLNKKVVLEGVSRGGLICYNWAKKNPGKVSCMYLDAPVCDIKSWPGEKGNGRGSKADWSKALKAYGLSESELLVWKGNPIDGLEGLAQAKVPILHSIGGKDQVVPESENTFILMKRYIDLGGPFSVYPQTKGEQKLHGHHFKIEDPDFIVKFIENHSKVQETDYFQLRGGLENSRLKFVRTKKGRVAFLGGSITYSPGWRTMVCAELKRRFPHTKFDFIAAGIPSTGSTPGAFRLVRDVFKNGDVDLIFEEAAVNDSSNGRSNTEQIRGMEGIVRHARRINSEIDIVMMHFVDPNKMKTYNMGKVPEVIQNHESVAVHYKLPSINLALEVTERINNKEFTWRDDFKNLHPSPFGQKLYFSTINRLFDTAWPGEIAEDDKVIGHVQPLKRVDKFSYDKARLEGTQNAFELKGFQQVKKWKNTVGGGTRPGFVNVPMLVGNKPGDSFKMKFKGRGIGVFVAAGPDAGILEYRVDSGEWKTQDLFTPWSRGLHLPWLYVLSAELEFREHIVEVRVSTGKNKSSKGTACRIVNFAINN